LALAGCTPRGADLGADVPAPEVGMTTKAGGRVAGIMAKAAIADAGKTKMMSGRKISVQPGGRMLATAPTQRLRPATGTMRSTPSKRSMLLERKKRSERKRRRRNAQGKVHHRRLPPLIMMPRHSGRRCGDPGKVAALRQVPLGKVAWPT